MESHRDHCQDVILPGVCGFPKSQTRLFRELPLVEVQETFYRPVDAKRAARWRARAPADFTFTVTASQCITHDATSPTYRRSGVELGTAVGDRFGSFRDTREVWDGWRYTEAVATALRARAILFQTPPTFGPTPENLRNLYGFTDRIRGRPWSVVWEPRGPWPSHLIEKVCMDLGLVHGVDPFAEESVTVGLAYFRLHGSPPGAQMYHYAYTDEELNRVRELALEYDDAFVLFDNVAMFDDAVRFRELIDVPK